MLFPTDSGAGEHSRRRHRRRRRAQPSPDWRRQGPGLGQQLSRPAGAQPEDPRPVRSTADRRSRPDPGQVHSTGKTSQISHYTTRPYSMVRLGLYDFESYVLWIIWSHGNRSNESDPCPLSTCNEIPSSRLTKPLKLKLITTEAQWVLRQCGQQMCCWF